MNPYLSSRHSFLHTSRRASGYAGSAVPLAYGSRLFPLIPRERQHQLQEPAAARSPQTAGETTARQSNG